MVKEINEFINFSEFIETKISPDHYLIRYTNLIQRYILTNQNNPETLSFLKTFTSEKYLKIIQYVRTSELKYKKRGCTLSQQALQSLIFLYNNQYDSLYDAEEDDFNRITSHTTYKIFNRPGDPVEN